MPQHKGMRWQTAVEVVNAGVQTHINRRTEEVSRCQQLLQLLTEIGPPSQSPAETIKATATPKGRIAPGSIPDRVLEIVGEFGEPVTMKQVLSAKHGAKDYLVEKAVSALVRSGHLVATGSTTTRRYEMPARKGGRA